MQEVSQIETQHKDALERLAVEIVSEEFDIPDIGKHYFMYKKIN